MLPDLDKPCGDRVEIAEVTGESLEDVPGPEEIAEVRAQLRNLGAREKRPLSKLIRRATKQSRQNGSAQGAASSLAPTLDTLRATLVGPGGKSRGL